MADWLDEIDREKKAIVEREEQRRREEADEKREKEEENKKVFSLWSSRIETRLREIAVHVWGQEEVIEGRFFQKTRIKWRFGSEVSGSSAEFYVFKGGISFFGDDQGGSEYRGYVQFYMVRLNIDTFYIYGKGENRNFPVDESGFNSALDFLYRAGAQECTCSGCLPSALTFYPFPKKFWKYLSDSAK